MFSATMPCWPDCDSKFGNEGFVLFSCSIFHAPSLYMSLRAHHFGRDQGLPNCKSQHLEGESGMIWWAPLALALPAANSLTALLKPQESTSSGYRYVFSGPENSTTAVDIKVDSSHYSSFSSDWTAGR